ncbi:hypothetical protein [Jannaschia rubra]|uniref:hypothetical protein n=2 Tax=Jannaschia rubra TaxID=282197 RepID=UPI001160140C|nr:hypothetical protein [Jannaschia rubra]
MLTTIIIIFIAFLAIRWAMKKAKTKDKPLWSIGYALYFLTDIFTQGYDSDEALGRVVATSRNGMPDLSDFSSQHVIVGLKAYANAQGEISKLNSPSVIQSLSEAVAVEARTTLQMATSQSNIAIFFKNFDPDISDERLKGFTEDAMNSIQQKPLSEEGKYTLHELVKSYLMRSFERHHKKDFYSFAAESSQKLVSETV